MVEEKIFAIIGSHFDLNRDSLTLNTNFTEDIHADSLDLVELIMAFEDEFGISIPDEVALSVKCIGDIVNYIEGMK